MLFISYLFFLLHAVQPQNFQAPSQFRYVPVGPPVIETDSGERLAGPRDFAEDSRENVNAWDSAETSIGGPVPPGGLPVGAPFQQSKLSVHKQVDMLKLQTTSAPVTFNPFTFTTAATENTSSNTYAINFCDPFEFPDELLASYGLERVEHFIWNTTCSSLFFQCSGGQTYALRCPSESQAFDRTVTNCNYRNAMEICPEFDHVLYCSIKKSCSEMEFACCAHPQRCIPLSKRCDGHLDCSDGDDENNCPSCTRYEFACVKSGRCIPAEKRCDGVPDDCRDYSNWDELGCNMNATCVGKFMCHLSQQEPLCVEWANHCDGVKNCANGEDELNCRKLESKFIACEDQKQTILRENWCDGKVHCEDGSDEKYCY